MELDNPVIAHEPEKRPKKWDTSFIQEPSAILVASLCCPVGSYLKLYRLSSQGFIIRDLAAYNKMNERLWCYLGTWCCLIPPVQSVLVQIQREKIRNRKRIENSFTKFLLSFICYPCALAQTRLELLNDEEVGKKPLLFQ